MSAEKVDLDLSFSNEELANFLENFSEKLRDGEIGLSFKGREELRIEPNTESNVEIEFVESDMEKMMELRIDMAQEDFDVQDEEGRKKISVRVEE
ncbi:amphi-Trp domain-containing protein [Nanohaloarchaea archaeon]|jgi:amphi-Trp domain-containing protein|nr:amphi-Trp domain-containing protein [Nanohaloarchaea archaeon H12]NMI76825.1 amphi-Trp domain-containing protein [Candidatus Nanohaloarchaea archaeon]NMJ77078.1 amphi-Trp domain-containing protein [Candidatus Nanohaloarchaea archaeon]